MHRLRSSAHAVRMHWAARACQVARHAHSDWPQGHLHISMTLALASALCKGRISRALRSANS